MKLQKTMIACAAALIVSMPIATLAADAPQQNERAAMVQGKMDQFIATLNLNAEQKDLWTKHTASMQSQKAEWEKARAIHEKYGQIKSSNPVEGMQNRINMDKEMESIRAEKLQNMESSLTTFKAFYNSLNADQKAKVDKHYQERQVKKQDKMKKKMKNHDEDQDHSMDH